MHLFPDSRHMCHHGIVIIFKIFFFPHRFKQLLCIHNFIGVFAQKPHNIKFHRCQFQIFPVQSTQMAVFPYIQPPDMKFFALFVLFCIIPPISAQLRLYPRHQFKRIKRFCHIIICPHRKAFDFVNVFHFCRKHNNRKIIRFPYFLTQRKSINIRQHNIKNRQINFLCFNPRQCFFSTAAFTYLITVIFQINLY